MIAVISSPVCVLAPFSFFYLPCLSDPFSMWTTLGGLVSWARARPSKCVQSKLMCPKSKSESSFFKKLEFYLVKVVPYVEIIMDPYSSTSQPSVCRGVIWKLLLRCRFWFWKFRVQLEIQPPRWCLWYWPWVQTLSSEVLYQWFLSLSAP